MKRITFISITAAMLLLLVGGASCSKTKSYSELLRTEEKAVNWYMSNQRIIDKVPEDSVFEIGSDAPFYKMDEEGYVYMQVINPGNPENKAKNDQLIYFRYLRTNILDMYEGRTPTVEGNANNADGLKATSFRFNNFEIPSSSKYGSGVQVPLRYLGLDCEVNIVIRAYYGFTGETGTCQPYVYNIKYYPAQY